MFNENFVQNQVKEFSDKYLDGNDSVTPAVFMEAKAAEKHKTNDTHTECGFFEGLENYHPGDDPNIMEFSVVDMMKAWRPRCQPHSLGYIVTTS